MLVSVALTIQPAGSAAVDGQTFADRVEPTARKWIVYAVPPLAEKGTLVKIDALPATFFCSTRLAPSM
jgi:hypothetical protein